MKKYYDIINKKQTFTFRSEEETIISTDDRVKCFWEQLEEGEQIEFDSNNFPFKVKYELQENGSKYNFYLPIENGIYKPDLVKQQEQLKAQTKKEIDQSIENHFNIKAKEWGYDNIDRAITYENSTIAEWKNEAIMFKTWRDRVWYYVYLELQKVENGTRELPTPESVLTEIPTLESIADELGVTY